MRIDLWLLSDDGEVLPKVVAELSLFRAPVKELQHVLPDPCLGLRSKDPVRLYPQSLLRGSVLRQDESSAQVTW